MEFSITITPGLSPMDRGALEDMLCDQIPVDCVGGGTLLTEPMVSDSQFLIERDLSADDIRAAVKAVYGAIEFTLPTEVVLDLDGRQEVV